MKNSNVPDFGVINSSFRYGDNEVVLEARAYAPGLTLHDLVMTYTNAALPNGDVSGNPSSSRGVEAVVKQVLEAIYSSEYKPCKCD